ncbi:MAG: hypothetical protein ACJ768_15690 [Gaiellaceae bacterium]
MNLFVVGWSLEGAAEPAVAERAVAGLLERLPFFEGLEPHVWRAASGAACAVCVSHPPEQTGGARYTHFDPEHLALYAGRPFRWSRDDREERRGPPAPGHYLHPPETWMRDLDGRCTVVRYTDSMRTLEVFCDPMGSYPVFAYEAPGVIWISNNAEVLRSISGSSEVRLEALAGMLGGGWSLSGDPRWAAIRRLERGTLHSFPESFARRIDVLPLEEIVAGTGAGFNAKRAAELLTRAVAALAAWPGRPSLVPVTGGRDSRLILAAALRAEIEFEAITGGEPQSPDVTIGRLLAEAGSVRHSLIPGDPNGNVMSDWRRAAEVLDLTSSGTACLADAVGFPLGPRPGPLPLWHSGQGGEIARGYYALAGRGELVDRLYRAFVARRPGRTELLSEDGAWMVRAQIASFVREVHAAGAADEDVPDLFYLLRRMSTWAGPSHGAVEWVRDTTSPLWSRRLLKHELGLPARERAHQEFHRRVLQVLNQRLLDIPYESTGRRRTLLRKVFAELHRRRAAPSQDDPFVRILPEIRDVVLSQPDHPAWPLLDRARTEQLLAADAASLDTMSRYYAWRLATVFAA